MSEKQSSEKSGLSRRTFIKGATLVGATGVLSSALTACSSTDSAGAAESTGKDIAWDKEADVVVIGSGASGMTTAIAAARAGASVLIIEKASEEDNGGNSKVSGNCWTFPTDAEKGYQYYIDEGKGILDPVFEKYMRRMADDQVDTNDDFMIDLPDMEIVEVAMFSPEQPGLEGSDAIQCYINKEFGSGRFWLSLFNEAMSYDTVEIVYETPGKELIQEDDGTVIGVIASPESGDIYIKAKKGVVIAAGGYEFDFVTMQDYYPGWPVYSRGTPYNTGDGMKMAQKAGANLWHMISIGAGACAMKCPGLDFGNGNYDSDLVTANISMPAGSAFLKLNKEGKRFMAEDREERHGFGHKEYLLWFDGLKTEWPNLPYWVIFDDATAKLGAIGKGSGDSEFLTSEGEDGGTMPWFTWFAAHSGHVWSADNSKEVELGWILKADTLDELAGLMSVDPAVLADTVATYNGYCAEGADPDFGARKLTPIGDGPYYAFQGYPTQYNTQGGPKRNENAQTLDPFDEPIPRLYNVGECGAGWAWLYNGGSNLAECVTTGLWAGSHAAGLEAWTD